MTVASPQIVDRVGGGTSLQPAMSSPTGPVTPGRGEQKTLTSITSTNLQIVPPPAAQRDRAVLVRMDAAHAGQVSAIEEGELRLGRHQNNGIVLEDDGISRVHARIYKQDESYFVEDLRSSNGTYLNGARIDSAELVDGALVQLGPRVHFRFSVLDQNQERMLRQLYESSVRDALTGAYNRGYFMERVAGELAFATRHQADVSVLLFDIDHFKKINDTFGHPAGDAVLRQLSQTVQRVLRTEDVFARYGGEEFIVLLRATAIDGAARAAERLRAAVQASGADYEGRRIDVTVSVGCASLFGCDKRPADALIAAADRRLYAAKATGRNRVVATD